MTKKSSKYMAFPLLLILSISIISIYNTNSRRKKKDDDSRGKKIHSSIAEEETEKLMPGTPDIVIDPPSKTNTPDESSPLNKTSDSNA